MVLLASIVFALQVTAVTPLTGSTSSQHIENQQGAVADGLLTAETENGTLKETLLYWNSSEGRFHNSSRLGYTSGGPPTDFGAQLNQTFQDRNVAFNVDVYYIHASNDRRSTQMVNLGEASDHASVATQSITLYDDDRLRRANGTVSDQRLGSTNYFASDIDPDSRLYNVVEVRVIVWRM